MRRIGFVLALAAAAALPALAAAQCRSHGGYGHGGGYFGYSCGYPQSYDYQPKTVFEYVALVPLYLAGYVPPPADPEKSAPKARASADPDDARLKALESRVAAIETRQQASDGKLDAILAAVTGKPQAPAPAQAAARQDAPPPVQGQRPWQRVLAASCVSCHGAGNPRGGFRMVGANGKVRDDFTAYEAGRITVRTLGESTDARTGAKKGPMPPQGGLLSAEDMTDLLTIHQDVKR